MEEYDGRVQDVFHEKEKKLSKNTTNMREEK